MNRQTVLAGLMDEKALLDTAMDTWTRIKDGSEESLEVTMDVLSPISDKIEVYKDLQVQEAEAKEVYQSAKQDSSIAEDALNEARARLDELTAKRKQAEKAIDDYIQSLETKNTSVVVLEAGDVDTGVNTNLMVYVGTTLLTGAMAIAFLQRYKREEH